MGNIGPTFIVPPYAVWNHEGNDWSTDTAEAMFTAEVTALAREHSWL